ncbi:YadA-like family protein [Burkholderia dolosa]|uniref:YadA-like family protein n=1 Tax=Burkholderia dolosa TaxID=152500 RepID=UPI0015902C92|nr:YadA-like family protein [Burkholderia dolosa]MBR8456693.1 YadA-like family protein [Burkholderia dolosa]
MAATVPALLVFGVSTDAVADGGIYVNDGTDSGCLFLNDNGNATLTKRIDINVCGSADKAVQKNRALFFNHRGDRYGDSTDLSLGGDLYVNGTGYLSDTTIRGNATLSKNLSVEGVTDTDLFSSRYLKMAGADARVATATGADSIALGAGANAEADSAVALGSAAVAKRANTVSVGNSSSRGQRQIVNVAAGTQGTDAVNVSQLSGVIDALGGGAAVNADGTFVEPAYSLGGTRVHTIDGALSNLDGRVTKNATSVDKLQRNFVDSGLVDKETGKVIAAVTSDQLNAAIAKNWVQIGEGASATPNTIAIGKDAKAGGEGLAGAIAIGEGARAAASGSRYVAAPVAVGDHATVDVRNGSAFGGSARVAAGATWSVALGADSVATRADTVSVGDERGDLQRQIVNVAAGTQDTDAVNVKQLNEVAAGMTANTESIENLQDDFAHSRLVDRRTGLVTEVVAYDRQSGDTADRRSVTLGGAGAAVPVALKNVAAGVADTDAVNVGQLQPIRDDLDNINLSMRSVKIRPEGVAANAVGMNTVAIGSGANAIADGSLALGGGSRANGLKSVAIGFNSVATDENQVSVGDSGLERRISNVAQGTKGTDAVNLDQLKKAMGAVSDQTKKLSSDLKSGHSLLVASLLADRDVIAYDDEMKSAITLSGEHGVTLKNVAAGAVSATSTDAVNGSQLNNAATSIANAIGGGAVVDKSGRITVDSIEVGGHKYATISEAVRAAAAYGATDSLAVRYDLDLHGNPNFGSVTLGGPASAPVMLTNVADGKSRYDAVNYGQLSALRSDLENRLDTMDDRASKIETGGDDSDGDDRGMTQANLGNDANNVATAPGSTIGDDGGNAVATGANSTVQASGGTSIGIGPLSAGSSTTNSNGIAADMNGIGSDKPTVTAGSNSVAIGANSTDGGRQNVVSVGSDTQQRQITNVAPGTQGTDAVNVNQLTQVQTTLSSALSSQQTQINMLGSQLQQTDQMAKQGIAAVGAMASVPQLDRDANFGMGVGTSTFLGQKAMAVNMQARLTENLKASINGGFSGTQKVIGAGMLYQWK